MFSKFENKNTAVDIIMPNYNKEQFIEETIISIITQTYKNWHLYIIDDSSTDSSVETINKFSNLTNIIIVFLILAIFITVGPELDIYISSVFYYGNNQFMVQSYYLISIIFRKILLPLLLIYIFVFPILSKLLPIQKIYFGYKFSISEIVYIWISGTVTMLLMVNVVLKNMWGRARPNDVSYFNGFQDFSLMLHTI